MDLGIVFLKDGPGDTLEILLRPVDSKGARDRLHEPLVALKYLQWPGDPLLCQQGRMGTGKGYVGIGEAFPVREPPGSGHSQGIKGRPTDRDGVRCPLRIEAECLRY